MNGEVSELVPYNIVAYIMRLSKWEENNEGCFIDGIIGDLLESKNGEKNPK
jgi:hypothetical protein